MKIRIIAFLLILTHYSDIFGREYNYKLTASFDIYKPEFKNALFNLRARTNGGLLTIHPHINRCERRQLRLCMQ